MSTPIPMLDLAAAHAPLAAELRTAAARVLDSAQFVMGAEVQAFEDELAAALDVPHVVSCASGTDALILALEALALPPGSEVLVPAVTFVASAEAIVRARLVPVFVDVDDHGLMAAASVQAVRTEQTRAALVVHLYGRPADDPALRDALADLAIVEDCAQSFGAAPCFVGSTQAYSFFPSKTLGGFGDGGALATTDAATAECVRALRNHGASGTYVHDRIGINSRLDALQAALLRVKLPHVATWTQARATVAAQYTQRLSDVSGLTLPKAHAAHVWHQYTLHSAERDALQAQLAADNIDSRVYYPVPLHRQQAYQHYATTALPAAEQWCATCLSLPLFPELDTERIERICAHICRVLE